MTSETRGIVEDLREWTELKIDLAVREIEEVTDDALSQIALGITIAVLVFFTGLFGLTTVALGLGWLLGRPFWGFLIVFALLLAFSGVVFVVAKRRPIVVESGLFRWYRKKLRRDRVSRDESEPSVKSSRADSETPAAARTKASDSDETTSSA